MSRYSKFTPDDPAGRLSLICFEEMLDWSTVFNTLIESMHLNETGGGRAGVRAWWRGRDNKPLSEKVFYPAGKCGLSHHTFFGGEGCR